MVEIYLNTTKYVREHLQRRPGHEPSQEQRCGEMYRNKERTKRRKKWIIGGKQCTQGNRGKISCEAKPIYRCPPNGGSRKQSDDGVTCDNMETRKSRQGEEKRYPDFAVAKCGHLNSCWPPMLQRGCCCYESWYTTGCHLTVQSGYQYLTL